ncbi:hypothetical protein GCM10007382_28510 [Salinibacterium xinjiangense]|nr:hypothetical protein GCM10007382_28510 [Salinibacterium xinjiangense]
MCTWTPVEQGIEQVTFSEASNDRSRIPRDMRRLTYPSRAGFPVAENAENAGDVSARRFS